MCYIIVRDDDLELNEIININNNIFLFLKSFITTSNLDEITTLFLLLRIIRNLSTIE